MINRRSLLILLAILLLALQTKAQAQTDKHLFPILKNRKWSYMDQTGRIVIKPRFQLAFDFSEGSLELSLGIDEVLVKLVGLPGEVANLVNPVESSSNNSQIWLWESCGCCYFLGNHKGISTLLRFGSNKTAARSQITIAARRNSLFTTHARTPTRFGATSTVSMPIR